MDGPNIAIKREGLQRRNWNSLTLQKLRNIVSKLSQVNPTKKRQKNVQLFVDKFLFGTSFDAFVSFA